MDIVNRTLCTVGGGIHLDTLVVAAINFIEEEEEERLRETVSHCQWLVSSLL